MYLKGKQQTIISILVLILAITAPFLIYHDAASSLCHNTQWMFTRVSLLAHNLIPRKYSNNSPLVYPKMSTSGPSDNPALASAGNIESQGDPNHIQTQTPLPLPAPEDASTNKIDMSSGSGSISMDHLGPLVVNKDGTLSRISNWAEMSEIEKRNTMRILVKRNQIRTDELKAVQAQEGTDAERRAEEGS